MFLTKFVTSFIQNILQKNLQQYPVIYFFYNKIYKYFLKKFKTKLVGNVSFFSSEIKDSSYFVEKEVFHT